jgi:hypothetical protein
MTSMSGKRDCDTVNHGARDFALLDRAGVLAVAEVCAVQDLQPHVIYIGSEQAASSVYLGIVEASVCIEVAKNNDMAQNAVIVNPIRELFPCPGVLFCC